MKRRIVKPAAASIQLFHPAINDLHPARLLNRCRTSRLARTIIVYDEAPSTNEVAMAAAASGASEGLLVIAEEQTLGKGRKGRAWHSSRGKSITCSLLLRPPRREEGLTAILACAVIDALGAFADELRMKWPNDIYCQGKKLGGILAESRDDVVVMGFGLNIHESARDLPADIAGEAISLRIASKKRVDRGLVLCRVLEAFERLYDRFQIDGFVSLRTAVERHLLYVGKRVAIESGGRGFEGIMLGITDEGHLRLNVEGTERVFATGDLSLREKPRGA